MRTYRAAGQPKTTSITYLHKNMAFKIKINCHPFDSGCQQNHNRLQSPQSFQSQMSPRYSKCLHLHLAVDYCQSESRGISINNISINNPQFNKRGAI